MTRRPSPYKKKKTLRQHFDGAVKTTAALAAAGACVTGYHFYGTHEDIDVTITAVDATQPDRIVFTTPQGSFINSRSIPHLKLDESTQDVDDQLRAGARLRLRVYGFNPQLGRFGLHSLGLHRPVLQAAPAPDAATLDIENPPAPRWWQRIFQGGAPYRLRTVSETSALPPLTAGRSCTDSDALDRMYQVNPQVYRDVAFMERLPISGRPLFNVVTDARYRIRSCLLPFDRSSSTAGTHQDGTITMMRGLSAHTTLHEYFHALQHFREDKTDTLYQLTPADYAFANALNEAAALAYSVMAEREARNRGLVMPGSVHTNYMSFGESRHHVTTFDRAYDESFAANTHMRGAARETAALEAGAQAVVRALIEGQDHNWTGFYANFIADNINRNMHLLGRNSATAPGYAALRRDVFYRTGMLAPGINLIPAEYREGDAARHIADNMQTLGLQLAPAGGRRGLQKPAA